MLIKEDVIISKEMRVGTVANNATVPELSFGDGDTGFYESADDTVRMSIGGIDKMHFNTNGLNMSVAGAPAVFNEASTSSNPGLLPNRDDTDTGIGVAAADSLSLIAGSKEGLRLTEASNFVIASAATSANVGLTAAAGSSQGDGVILASYNVYDTVGTAGDAATLPAVFQVGTLIYIKNGAAANSMDVFPASGDNAGAGANTAVAVAAGNFAVFMGTTANSTWEKIMGGTA